MLEDTTFVVAMGSLIALIIVLAILILKDVKPFD